MQKEKLDAYHDQLVEMRARLREEFSHRVEHLVPGESEEGSISRAPFHKADRNEGRVDEELEIQSTEGRILDDVERALERMREGNYGICQRCGQPIGEERLDALPYAEFCVSCQEAIDQTH